MRLRPEQRRAVRLIACALRDRKAVPIDSRPPMNHTLQDKPAHDHVQTALELSCAVLMTLELIRTRIGDSDADADGTQSLLERATDSLREVIAELRMA